VNPRPCPPPIGGAAKASFTPGAGDATSWRDRVTTENHGLQPDLGFWGNAEDWVSWKARFPKVGAFKRNFQQFLAHKSS
jgi:hypothetical protein